MISQSFLKKILKYSLLIVVFWLIVAGTYAFLRAKHEAKIKQIESQLETTQVETATLIPIPDPTASPTPVSIIIKPSPQVKAVSQESVLFVEESSSATTTPSQAETPPPSPVDTTSSSASPQNQIDSCSSYCISVGSSGGECRNNNGQCNKNNQSQNEAGNQYCEVRDVCCCNR